MAKGRASLAKCCAGDAFELGGAYNANYVPRLQRATGSVNGL
jgi:hypothetical protein